MGGREDCCTTQLIDSGGVFNVQGLEEFVNKVKLAQCGLSYAVVSIMGPQSSGKSTLMNHLFGTNFREMDALKGRYQTTKGIWVAKCIGIEPCTIAMDLEGTDARERGEDETFEKQSALFALAISDVVLINMWCHDIGREQAANIPLLKTVFQVMMRLFSPRKTTLFFVVRDVTKTPFKLLEPVLRDDVQKIWNSVSKPQIHKDAALNEFFHVEAIALASYENKEVEFKEQVAHLRQRFLHCIAPGGLAGDRRGVIPASAFCYSAQQIWKVIRENKDLDLPAHKVMVATVRCEEIANEKLSRLTSDEGWLALEKAVQFGPTLGFGRKLNSILEAYMSEYDMETRYFDDDVRIKKRKDLERKALHLVHPAFDVMLGHLRAQALNNFKNRLEQSLRKGKPFAASHHDSSKSCMLEFDQGCADATIPLADWDSSKVREKLHRDIEVHASSVRNEKLSEVLSHYKKQLTEALAGPTETLFDVCGGDTWAAIRKLLKHETDVAVSQFTAAISGFDLDQRTINEMINSLVSYARGVVEKKAREEAGRILIRMKDRFLTVFSHDHDSMPRVWSGNEDIRAITKDSYASVLRLLSVLAVVRLEEGKPDDIESTLLRSLADGSDAPITKTKSTKGSPDFLASSTWEGVSQNNTLITPVQCKSLWKQFKVETQYTIIQAISAQEAHRHGNNWLPPPWAILAMVALGFNEFMFLLRNPLYAVAILVVCIVTRAVWVQLNILGEFRHGTLAGILSVFSRLLAIITTFLRSPTGRQRRSRGHLTPVQALNSECFRSQVPRTTPHSLSVPEFCSTTTCHESFSESENECVSTLRHRQPSRSSGSVDTT